MKSIKLDSILLFALVIPVVMTYRISPRETPYWLFGLIFVGLFLYIVVDLLKVKEKVYCLWKQILLWILIIGVLGSVFVSAIIVRHETHPVYQIHDMPLQQEIAMRFLLDGKNPYAVTYFGTFLEQWHYSDKEVNPALYHFVLMPFYLVFALPFYAASLALFGFFDARMPLLFLFFVMLIVAAVLIKDSQKRLLFLTLLTFNPAVFSYFIEGRSDIFMFAFLFLGFFLLHGKRYFMAGVPIALAFAVKQSAWPILPFYVAFLYFNRGDKATTLAPSRWIFWTIPLIVTFSIIVLPFLFWDAKAFLDSTIFYLSGNVPNSYPVSGYGLGMLLNQIGIIKDLNQYYPFLIWQGIIGVPLGIFLIWYLKNYPTVRRLILVYGIFLFAFWYLSRYFNNSHLGYLSLVFITAYFFPENDAKV